MGELSEELGRAAKVLLWNLWRSLDPTTQQRIQAVAIPALEVGLAVALLLWIASLLVSLLKDLGKAPFGDSMIIAKASAFWSKLPSPRSPTSVAAIPAIILLLFAAFGTWPYNFYVLTRIIVCLASAWIAFQLHASRRFLWEFALIVVALIFNPVAPFHFRKETWELLNILGALTLAPAVFLSVGSKPASASRRHPPVNECNFCPHCGFGVRGADNFCKRCGVAIH
jgi:hypothetical protein